MNPDTLARGLAELGCKALLVIADSARDPDLAPFVGPAHLRRSLLIARAGEPPRLACWSPMEREEAASTGLALITPEQLDLGRFSREIRDPAELLATVTERALQFAGLAPGRLALAGRAGAGEVHAACLRLAADGWSFVSGHPLVLGLRRTKTAAQLAAIRHAAAGTVTALRRVAALLAASTPAADATLQLGGEPLTVGRLRAEVAATLVRFGLEQPDGNILAPAEEGAVPHNTGNPERVLRAGQSLIVDLFPGRTLFADCTRTFCVGPPPPPLARAHELVRQALVTAHQGICPGVSGWDLQEATCHFFEAQGYASTLSTPSTTTGYVHGLGHGVGVELHELPSFRRNAGADGILAEGDVFTLEPGLYDPEAGYAVRLEDLLWLGPAGVENLTPLPYELDPRAWGE